MLGRTVGMVGFDYLQESRVHQQQQSYITAQVHCSVNHLPPRLHLSLRSAMNIYDILCYPPKLDRLKLKRKASIDKHWWCPDGRDILGEFPSCLLGGLGVCQRVSGWVGLGSPWI